MDVVVKESNIHGKGVFATRDFKKGEVVIEWSSCSIPLSKEQVEQLPRDQKKYVSAVGDGTYVTFTSPGKYVNHSCDPNTHAENACDVAVKDISNGEEITADYVAEKVPELNFECKCGSKNCKSPIS